jgi:hypothetical protein
MYCPAKDVSRQVLKTFLTTQSKSLKVLRVLGNVDKLRRAVGNNNSNENVVGSELFALELPQKMDVLEIFQLSGRDKDTPIPVQPLDYNGSQFRRLNTLIINGYASNITQERMNQDYFPVSTGQQYSLRKFVLPAEIRGPDFPSRIGQLFPNLIELEVKYPDNDFLSGVFKNCKKLERLKILAESGLSIEQGIIGSQDEDENDDGLLSLKRNNCSSHLYSKK